MQQGLSIDEVMQLTKVSRRHVEALEDGRIEDLPHSVYVKGFIKIYSQVLKVNIPGLSQSVDAAYGELADDNHHEERRRSRTKDIPLTMSQRKSVLPRVFLWLFVLLLLGAAGYGGWYYFFSPQAKQSQAPSGDAVQEPAQPPSPDTPTAPDAFEEKPEVEAPKPSEPVAVQLPDLTTPELAPQEGNNTDVEAPPATLETPEAGGNATDQSVVTDAIESLKQPQPIVIASAEARAASEGVHILRIVGKGECWIEAKVDRDFTTDFYVRDGELVEVRFTRVLAVKFGNIGVVSLQYDDEKFTTAIPPSGVKTLTFPPTP